MCTLTTFPTPFRRGPQCFSDFLTLMFVDLMWRVKSEIYYQLRELSLSERNRKKFGWWESFNLFAVLFSFCQNAIQNPKAGSKTSKLNSLCPKASQNCKLKRWNMSWNGEMQAKMVDCVSPVKGAVTLRKNPLTGEMQTKMVKCGLNGCNAS